MFYTRHRQGFYRCITILTIITFLFESVGYTAPTYSQSPRPPVQIPTHIYIPEQYGRVGCSDVSNSPQVILIKDAHCVYEAQRNIENILDILVRDYGIGLVCVEGAVSKVDTSRLASYNNQKARQRVADKYTRNGLFTASEALGIKKGLNPGFNIYGVEDARLYWKDFQAFRRTVGVSRVCDRFLELMHNLISTLKDRLYTAKLKEFDDMVGRYKRNEISLVEWVKYLSKQTLVNRGYKNFRLVQRSIQLEEKIDFKKVEAEREELIGRLGKILVKEELAELVKRGLLFKLGKIPAVDYYTYLERFGGRIGENLRKYIRLVKLQSKIDEEGLFSEIDLLTEDIYQVLIIDEIAGKLHRLDKDIDILDKVVHLKAERRELLYYSQNRERFASENLLSFIRIQAPLNGIPIPTELNSQSFLMELEEALIPSGEFYKLAIERDKALVDNLTKRMAIERSNKAVLICGGFHSEGIIDLLKKRGIDVITITPSITKVQEDSQKIYLSRMMDERIRPDQIIAGLGMENLGAPVACDTSLGDLLLKHPIKELEELCNRVGVGKEITIGEFLKMEVPGKGCTVGELLVEEYLGGENPAFSAFLKEMGILPLILPPTPAEKMEGSRREDAEGGAIIPSIQDIFGRFGKTRWYRVLVAPVIEELIFRFSPIILFYFIGHSPAVYLWLFVGMGLLFYFLHQPVRKRFARVVSLINTPFVASLFIINTYLLSGSILAGVLIISVPILVHIVVNMYILFIEELIVIRNGGYNPKDFVHRLIGYWIVVMKFRSALRSRPGYEEYVKRCNKEGEYLLLASDIMTSSKHRAELIYLTWEAYRLKKFIDEVKEKSNRPVVIVENLRYGRVAIAPIRKILEEEKIPIWSVKCGSTPAHDNPDVLSSEMFTHEQIEYLIQEQPIVLVIDGSYSLDQERMQMAGFNRQAPRYPDARQWFSNWFAVFTDVVSGGMEEKELKERFNLLFGLGKRNGGCDGLYGGEYRKLREMIRDVLSRMSIQQTTSIQQTKDGYRMYYWTPSELDLKISENDFDDPWADPTVLEEHRLLRNLDKKYDLRKQDLSNTLRSPSIIFVQSCIEDSSVPEEIRRLCGRGITPWEDIESFFIGTGHSPCYFDDRDLIHNIGYVITPYGPRSTEINEKFVQQAYSLVKNLMECEKRKSSISNPYEMILCDLDGTLAKTLEPIDKEMIEYILNFLSNNVEFAVITAQSWDEVERNFFKPISEYMEREGKDKSILTHLHIFTSEGAIGFGFSSSGKRISYYSFGANEEEMEKVNNIIDELIKDTSIEKVDRGPLIMLHNIPEDKRDELYEQLNKEFSQSGIDLVVEKRRKTTIEIKLPFVGKWIAKNYMCARFSDIPAQKILVISDTLTPSGSDREMIVKGGHNIWVGGVDDTKLIFGGINKLPDFLNSLEEPYVVKDDNGTVLFPFKIATDKVRRDVRSGRSDKGMVFLLRYSRLIISAIIATILGFLVSITIACKSENVAAQEVVEPPLHSKIFVPEELPPSIPPEIPQEDVHKSIYPRPIDPTKLTDPKKINSKNLSIEEIEKLLWEYAGIIQVELNKQGLNLDREEIARILAGLIWQESGCRHFGKDGKVIRSGKGAIGIAQINGVLKDIAQLIRDAIRNVVANPQIVEWLINNPNATREEAYNKYGKKAIIKVKDFGLDILSLIDGLFKGELSSDIKRWKKEVKGLLERKKKMGADKKADKWLQLKLNKLQKKIYERLKKKFDIEVSPEANLRIGSVYFAILIYRITHIVDESGKTLLEKYPDFPYMVAVLITYNAGFPGVSSEIKESLGKKDPFSWIYKEYLKNIRHIGSIIRYYNRMGGKEILLPKKDKSKEGGNSREKRGSRPHKVPGSKGLDEDRGTDKGYIEKQIKGVVGKKLIHLVEQNKIDYLLSKYRSIKDSISEDDLMNNVIIHIVNSDKLGLERCRGARRITQLIPAIGKKGDDGKLHIYVTKKYWEGHLSQNNLLLAETIDHEWHENILSKSHREASSRARFFVGEGQRISAYHKFIIDKLVENSEFEFLKGILREEREPKDPDVANYEEQFKEYIRAKMKQPRLYRGFSGELDGIEISNTNSIVVIKDGSRIPIHLESKSYKEDNEKNKFLGFLKTNTPQPLISIISRIDNIYIMEDNPYVSCIIYGDSLYISRGIFMEPIWDLYVYWTAMKGLDQEKHKEVWNWIENQMGYFRFREVIKDDPVIRLLRSKGYICDLELFWLYSKRSCKRSQGWKIHIAAVPDEAEEVLKTVLPIIEKYGYPHKVVNGTERINGLKGTQVGKFICIYIDVEDEEIASQIALLVGYEIDRALYKKGEEKGRPFNKPEGLRFTKEGDKGDKIIHVNPGEEPTGLVGYRYGSFKGPDVEVNGSKVPDNRNIYKPVGFGYTLKPGSIEIDSRELLSERAIPTLKDIIRNVLNKICEGRVEESLRDLYSILNRKMYDAVIIRNLNDVLVVQKRLMEYFPNQKHPEFLNALKELIQDLSSTTNKVPGTHKVPGSKGLDEDKGTDKRYIEEQIKGVEGKKLIHLVEQNKIDYLLSKYRSIKDSISEDDLMNNVIIHIVNSDKLGLERCRGARRITQLIPAIGKKGDDGKLHIYVTKKYWEGHLSQNNLLLAETIDHEWHENILGESHREASSRARFFVGEGQRISAYHKFIIDKLVENSEFEFLDKILRQRRKKPKDPDVANYEKEFLAYIAKKLGGNILQNNATIYYRLEGEIVLELGQMRWVTIKKEDGKCKIQTTGRDKNSNFVTKTKSGKMLFIDYYKGNIDYKILSRCISVRLNGDIIAISNFSGRSIFIETTAQIVSKENFLNSGLRKEVALEDTDDIALYPDKGIPSWRELKKDAVEHIEGAKKVLEAQKGQEAGALLDLGHVKRLIVIGDLHGNYRNLMNILSQGDIWEILERGDLHIVLLGDVIHPGGGELKSDQAQEDSLRTLLLVVYLINRFPNNVHYIMGNHELSHINQEFRVVKGDVYQNEVFRDYLEKVFGNETIINEMKEFFKVLPAAIRINNSIVLTHAGASKCGVEQLEQLDATGFWDKQLIGDIIFRSGEERIVDKSQISKFLANLGCRLLITGHTPPDYLNADEYNFNVVYNRAIGEAFGKQIIVDSQGEPCGYLDIDLERSQLDKGLKGLLDKEGNSSLKILGKDVLEEVVMEILGVLEKWGIEIDKTRLGAIIEIALLSRKPVSLKDILSLVKDKIEKEKFFSLIYDICLPLNKLPLPKPGGDCVARILQGILAEINNKEIKEKENVEIEQKEDIRERFFNTVGSILKDKYGITDIEIESTLTLIEMGLFLITIDPQLDITGEGNYYDLLSQIVEMTGVSKEKLVEIFSEGYSNYQGQMGNIDNIDKDNKAVRRLRLYKKIVDEKKQGPIDVDLDLEDTGGLGEEVDFKGVVIEEPKGLVEYLSGTSVAVEQAEDFVKNKGLKLDKEQTISIPEKLFIEGIEGDKVTYSPGIVAILKRFPKLKVEIRTNNKDRVKRITDAIIRDNPSMNGRIVLATEFEERIENYNRNTVYVLSENQKDLIKNLEGEIKNNNLKVFCTDSMSLPATLLFGIQYGSIENIFMDGEYTKDVLDLLRLFGIEDSAIEEGFLIVIRTTMVLKQYQLYRVTIEISA